MTEQTIAVSIIIPTFNSESSILDCLNSARSQLPDNIEIICVDDGSTDKTCRLIKNIGDPKVRLIRNEHRGVSQARNAGIEQAQGEYIQFLDADDYLRPCCCKTAFDAAKDKGADCVFFGTELISDEPIPQWMTECTDVTKDFYRKFEDKLLFEIKGTKPFVWNQLIKRELLIKKKIRFDETLTLGEDQAFQFAYLPYAKNVLMLNEKLYVHRVYKTSTTFVSDNNLSEKIKKHCDVVSSILKTSKKHGFSFQRKACTWAIDFLHDDVIKNKNSSGDVRRAFSSQRMTVAFLPVSVQERAVQIGAAKKVKFRAFNNFIRRIR